MGTILLVLYAKHMVLIWINGTADKQSLQAAALPLPLFALLELP